MKANMKRVLRAMDVIPPFDSHSVSQEHRVDNMSPLPSPSVSQSQPPVPNVTSAAVASGEMSLSSAGDAIPTLDLGEKILAEQRRVIAGKRKRPGAFEPEPESRVCPEESLLDVTAPVQTASDDALRLQQIVAEIVTRDIERLCQGLKQRPCCPGQ